MKNPALIDYSIGSDNLIFVLLAIFGREIDLKVINLHITNKLDEEKVTYIRKLINLSGKDIKLCFSKVKPIIDVEKTYLEDEKALDFENNTSEAVNTMVSTLKDSKEKITVISTGALTNIATMLLLNPNIKDKIKKIIIVGGAIYGGNVTPCAEKNIFSDVYSADIVFESGIPIVMCGLDVTEKAILNGNQIDKLIILCNENQNDKLENFLKGLKEDKINLSNCCGLAYEFKSNIFNSKECAVTIETGGEFTTGCSLADINGVSNKEKNAQVLCSLNLEQFSSLLYDELSSIFENYNFLER